MGENRSCSLKRERDGVSGYLSSDNFLSLTLVRVSLPLPVLEFPAVLLQSLPPQWFSYFPLDSSLMWLVVFSLSSCPWINKTIIFHNRNTHKCSRDTYLTHYCSYMPRKSSSLHCFLEFSCGYVIYYCITKFPQT